MVLDFTFLLSDFRQFQGLVLRLRIHCHFQIDCCWKSIFQFLVGRVKSFVKSTLATIPCQIPFFDSTRFRILKNASMCIRDIKTARPQDHGTIIHEKMTRRQGQKNVRLQDKDAELLSLLHTKRATRLG